MLAKHHKIGYNLKWTAFKIVIMHSPASSQFVKLIITNKALSKMQKELKEYKQMRQGENNYSAP